MSGAGTLLITAPNADPKLITRLLLYLRDWKFGAGDTFKLHLTKSSIANRGNESSEATEPPVRSYSGNEWVGMSIDEVEDFMVKQDGKGDGSTSLFLLLDERGVREGTVIVAHRAWDEEAEEFAYLNEFNKTRVPWIKTYSMWCNLDIANMGFEDFVEDYEDDGEEDGDDDEKEEEVEDDDDSENEDDDDDDDEEKEERDGSQRTKKEGKRWYTFKDVQTEEGYYDKYIKQAEDAVAELRKEGLA